MRARMMLDTVVRALFLVAVGMAIGFVLGRM